MRRQQRENGHKISLCRNAADLEAARAAGRIGVMLDVQNTVSSATTPACSKPTGKPA